MNDVDHTDEKLERLIVRSLDGALDEAEQLALQRELLRNLAAKRTAEAYARIDALAGEVLGSALGTTSRVPKLEAVPPVGIEHVRRLNWRVLVPGAIAAALLALALPRLDMGIPSSPVAEHPAGSAVVPVLPHTVPAAGITRNVSQLPRVQSDSGREVIGIFGDDGRLYWIEVDRTRILRQPPRLSRDASGYGEL